MEIGERLKKLDKLLGRLRGRWILVEGVRDKRALSRLGMTDILTISGNLIQSCDILSAREADKAFVLTDLDRRGDELAKKARDELEGRSIRADIHTRVDLAHLLKIRCFEDASRAYEKLKQEGEQNG
ncbi:MAG: toprim domain-containing protein [Candidatus Micrarchaeota archaeon]